MSLTRAHSLSQKTRPFHYVVGNAGTERPIAPLVDLTADGQSGSSGSPADHLQVPIILFDHKTSISSYECAYVQEPRYFASTSALLRP